MRTELTLALDVPRWTWRFYLRHLPLIAGLSLVASVQRLVAVNWGIPGPLALVSEVVVMATRLLLLAVIWRLAMRDTPWRWASLSTFAHHHWRSLVIQGVLVSVAFLIFDVFAESVVGGLLSDDARPTYLAVLLFVKNPTMIALTFVWWVGLARQMLRNTEQATPVRV
ncbi:hypothetical protein [Actinophytocola algeriensis]|uniref:FlaA1/EpsC-like NDP-sugar epimerase n=1 Tax=Actinophytocola algeriensis TaxID=1768010 RepID=A0A7W7QEH3_9PSEU|nr:hypothetical protein [Actinophytocola algeriensis]MBB4912171.1 FlaA1/EpsC-like NDP-sugar epimerase [Actinophytocola algeriensis]MBE1474313.1 FlaA1/EpsC-like NDP-sugar epimerase [Actinophytocola algeriensis]